MPVAIFGRSNAQSMCSPIPLSGAVILVMREGTPACDSTRRTRSERVPNASRALWTRGARGSAPGRPPLLEPGGRRLLAERSLVESQLHQVVQGLPHGAPRADA